MGFNPNFYCPVCGQEKLLPRIIVGNELCCRDCCDKVGKKFNNRLKKIKLKDMTLYDLKKVLIKEGIVK